MCALGLAIDYRWAQASKRAALCAWSKMKCLSLRPICSLVYLAQPPSLIFSSSAPLLHGALSSLEIGIRVYEDVV